MSAFSGWAFGSPRERCSARRCFPTCFRTAMSLSRTRRRMPSRSRGPETGVWRILRRPLQPVPVTNRVVEAEKERRLRALEESPDGGNRVVINGVAVSSEDSQRRARERIANLDFFDEVSVLRGLRTTWNGKIWVQRRGRRSERQRRPHRCTVSRRTVSGQLSGRSDRHAERIRPAGIGRLSWKRMSWG